MIEVKNLIFAKQKLRFRILGLKRNTDWNNPKSKKRNTLMAFGFVHPVDRGV